MILIDYAKEVREFEQRSRAPKIEVRGNTSDMQGPDQWLINALLGQTASSTGITVTPLNILGVATVFACHRIHAETMASLPCYLTRGDGKGGTQNARDHRLFHVMNEAPNSEMTSYDFISAMQVNLVGRQNAYAEILKDIDGDPVGLYPIDPTLMNLYRDSLTFKLVYQFQQNGTKFKPEEILHLRGFTRGGLLGADMSRTLQDVFALAMALQDNAAKFFGNQSRPGAILEHPAVMGDEAAARLKKQIEESTSGNNAQRLLLLEEGLKWSKQRTDNKDSQFQEAREYQDLQIARVFRIPPHKLGIMSGQPRANIEEENLMFVQDVVRPCAVLWEKALNSKLLTIEEREQEYQFCFQLDDVLRGNLTARYTAYAQAREWGWMSANTILKLEKMNPVGPAGDIILQPANFVPLGTLPSPTPNEPGMGDNKKPGAGASDDDTTAAPAKPAPAAPATPAPQKAGTGGTKPAPEVEPIIETPPGKPKNLNGLEDSVRVQP